LNLATFRSRISGAIGLSNIASSTEQSLIDGWVNEGVVDFLRRTKMHTRMAALALTANQYSYELDTDILSFKDAWYQPASGTSVLLRMTDASDILYMRTLTAAAGFPVAYYALEGQNMLLLHPAPQSSSDQLHLLYVPRPAALAATAEAPSATANGGIPSEYHQIIEAYAKWKAADYADDQSSGMGQAYQQEYMQGVVDAMKSTTLKGGVRLGGVVWGRKGSKQIPTTPGTDLGA
jgi:hypothetical protein